MRAKAEQAAVEFRINDLARRVILAPGVWHICCGRQLRQNSRGPITIVSCPLSGTEGTSMLVCGAQKRSRRVNFTAKLRVSNVGKPLEEVFRPSE